MKSFAIISLSLLLSSWWTVVTNAFLGGRVTRSMSSTAFISSTSVSVSSSLLRRMANNNNNNNNNDQYFEVTVDMPPRNSGLQANMKFKSILPGPSEIVQVRYQLPFGLNVAPKDNLAVCTQDGPGGEQVGDILRYSSQWTMGLPGGDGLATTVAAFSGGGLGWKCTLFDVLKAQSWEILVEALTSNVPSRTDEIVLLFERPLEKQ